MTKPETTDFRCGPLTYVERELTISERSELVKIAHETGNADIRRWAIDTLERASVPPLIFRECAA